jgi:phosphopantothenoylcysteine decarboxylase / phosphopantothenate---cysteine ligase
MDLSGKKILLGICGSIAAYKSILLTRLLVKQGAEVKIVITPAAKDFVSPLVLSTLSKNDIAGNLFEGDSWANHVMMGRWADLMLVAPATCNTLAKMATGQCDNLLLAVYLSATCPVMISPAMDEDMWQHASTRRNIMQLEADGVQIIPVGYGELGSGLTGEGRMAEPEQILHAIEAKLSFPDKPLQGRKAIVTAGPTYEAIDPVRFIGNHSSGKMGVSIANQLQRAGAEVTLILGPSDQVPEQGIVTKKVQSAREMFNTVTQIFPQSDISVFAAAVADYRPLDTYESKWKKEVGGILPPVLFTENPDILKHCGTNKAPHQIVIGFALETENEEENAIKKLKSKHADWIILNSLRDEGAGFGGEHNKVTIIGSNGGKIALPMLTKDAVALEIVKTIIEKGSEV